MHWPPRLSRRRAIFAGAVVLLVASGALAPAGASGQTVEAPFDASYSVSDLGAPPGVPARLGGLTLKSGTTDRLLIGGDANEAGGALYEVGLTRDPVTRHITGFAAGNATQFAAAPFNDGGVAYGPGGVLFLSRWDTVLGGNGNRIGQTKPGSSITDKTIELGPLGVAHSPGGLVFVPSGQPGAGSLKLASYPDGEWYDADVAPDGSGTYDVQNVAQVVASTVAGGPEGIVYVSPGSPEFNAPSVLISEFDQGQVGAYEVDAGGDPVPATRRTFLSGLTGAEGAFIDPLTGDFLFSTFGAGDRVIVVRGFAATAATLTVVKHLVNDNGGGAAAGAWSMHVKSGGVDVAGSPFAGAEAPGVTRVLPAGSYTLSESGGPGGYNGTISGDCAANGAITLQPGDSKTCTITNDDVPPPPPPPPPVPPQFEPVPDPAPTPGVWDDKVLGWWKLRGSSTSVVYRTTRHGLFGAPAPAPIWGWSPTWTARVFRPAGCYRRVGRLAWVIGFGSGGAFYRYRPNSGCQPIGPTTARWFLNGPNGLRQQYLEAGPTPRSPSRQVRLFWERTRPLLALDRPAYNQGAGRLTISFRTFAHWAHRVELRKGTRVIDAQNVRMRDGRWTIRFNARLAEEDTFAVVVSARCGARPVQSTRRFMVLENGSLRHLTGRVTRCLG
jgi:Prealbumin-like fold domain